MSIFTRHRTAKTAYQYNLKGELVQAEDTDLTNGNTLLDRETWGLDAAGNWLSHSRTATSLMETRTTDALNRLMQVGGAGSTVVEGRVNEFASVTVNGQPATLRADPVAGGYRFQRTVPVNAGSNTVTISATDLAAPPQPAPLTTSQSWQFNVPAVSRTFSYDANGNTLGDGVRTMTWDAKNRLKTATRDGTTWKWDYDFMDRRVREYTNNVLSKVFIWSGTDVVQERTAANAITRTHYFGGFSDGPAPASGTKYQTLTDHLGNIREVLDAAGTVAARYDYTPYQGPVKVGTSTVTPTFLTIGGYYHHEGSGLEFALYRVYDPVLGRWLSRDPIGEDGGINLYGYVLNSPIGLIDPDGADPQRVPGTNENRHIVSPGKQAGPGQAIRHVGRTYDNQCAAGAQHETGTATHDAPDTDTWTQGPAVSRQTPYGTMIAEGWEGGEYPNRDAGNHTCIFLGMNRDGTMQVREQYLNADGSGTAMHETTRNIAGYNEVRTPVATQGPISQGRAGTPKTATRRR